MMTALEPDRILSHTPHLMFLLDGQRLTVIESFDYMESLGFDRTDVIKYLQSLRDINGFRVTWIWSKGREEGEKE